MNMLKIFSLKTKKHQGTTDVDNQVKQILKDVDDKVKDDISSAEALAKLSDKNLARDPAVDSAFVSAFAKFVTLIKQVDTSQQALVQEQIDKFSTPVSAFHKTDVIEQTKTLRKQYEKAIQDYNTILSKVEATHAKKGTDIAKLYEVEKERVRQKKIWEAAVYDIRTHCEDILERVNIDFLQHLVECMEVYRKQHGDMYTNLAEVAEYLNQLLGWCAEEKTIFNQHLAERAKQRTQLHLEEAMLEVRQFGSELDTEMVDSIKKAASSNPSQAVPGGDVDAAVAELFQLMGIASVASATTDRASQLALPALDPNAPVIGKLQSIVKTNFDALGSDLLARNKQDKLISMSECVALLEKVSIQKAPTAAAPNPQ